MAGLIPLGTVVDPSRDVFPTTGAHLDVRVMPLYGPQKGKKVDPRTARGLLQNVLVGKDRIPLVQPQGQGWKWNFPVTSEFGQRAAPTAGASTFHRGIDVGLGVGTQLTYKGYGTFTPDRGFGRLQTTSAQGNPYEIRFLHTEPGKAASVGSNVVPSAPILPAPEGTPATPEQNTNRLMEQLFGKQTSLKDVLLSQAMSQALERRRNTFGSLMGSPQFSYITPQQAMEMFA